MIDFEKLRNAKGIRATYLERPTVNARFVKELRAKLNMPQTMFAQLLNVSNKTVEKWEQGANPVSNGNAIAMILFDSHPELVSDFIMIHDSSASDETSLKGYVCYTEILSKESFFKSYYTKAEESKKTFRSPFNIMTFNVKQKEE